MTPGTGLAAESHVAGVGSKVDARWVGSKVDARWAGSKVDARWAALVRVLDRPGGRRLLGLVATTRFRAASCDDVQVLYRHGLWTRRAGRDFFPDGPVFDYVFADFAAWKLQMARYVADANDYWLRYYSPAEGDVIVDAGAGRGEDAVAFSRAVGRTGRVIAIEADPPSFKILRSFCRLNGLINVTPVQCALMDKPGRATVLRTGSSWLESSVEGGTSPAGSIVNATTFDEIYKLEKLSDVAFLKMNIEGAERYALVGMGEALRRVRHICVACHDFRFEKGHGEQFRTRGFVDRFLRDAGFDVVSRWDDPRDYVRDHLFGLRRG